MVEAAIRRTSSPGGEVVLRWARPADTGPLLDLVRTALGTSGTVPRTEGFWRWKHEQNPFGASPIMVAEAAGGIVSLRVFMRWRWRWREQVLRAVRPVDTATRPDWRRRGLFERLTRQLVEEMSADGVAFAFNTPNQRSGAGYRKLGWQLTTPSTIWARPVRPLRALMRRWVVEGLRGGGAEF